MSKLKYIPASEQARCFICKHLIEDNTPDEGFRIYDVAIHQDCHDNISDFERIRRNGGLKGLVPALSHKPDAPPRPAQVQPRQPAELKESLAWAEQVREKAEHEVDKVANNIPPGVMHRLNHSRKSRPDGLSDRQYELIQMWDGIGAMPLKHPSSVDYHAINAAMDGLAKLPELKDYVKDWWLFNADRRNNHRLQVNFSSLSEHYGRPHTESGILLNDALRVVLRSLLPEMPSPSIVYVLLGNKEREKKESDRRRITLSEVVRISNSLELYRALVLKVDVARHYSVPEIYDILVEAGSENFIVDCGLARCAEDFNTVVSEFGERARMCKNCPNWFLLDADKVEFTMLYTTCPGCTVSDRPALPPDAPEPEPEKQHSALTVQVSLF